jgi:hypothetical protein
LAIYKDASGLIAQRISDSKASASELTRSAQVGRTIKELAQVPIRLMDRVTLRTYVFLLEKELNTAKAALATLDANENVLAGGGGYVSAAFTSGMNGAPRSKVSGIEGGSGGFIASSTGMTPTNVNRSSGISTNGNMLNGSTTVPPMNRTFSTAAPTPNGSSPRAAAAAAAVAGRTSASALTKYAVPSSGNSVTPPPSSTTFSVRGSASIAPSPPTSTIGNGLTKAPSTSFNNGNNGSSALMIAMTGTSSRNHTMTHLTSSVPASPSASESSAAPFHDSPLGAGTPIPVAPAPATTPFHDDNNAVARASPATLTSLGLMGTSLNAGGAAHRAQSGVGGSGSGSGAETRFRMPTVSTAILSPNLAIHTLASPSEGGSSGSGHPLIVTSNTGGVISGDDNQVVQPPHSVAL